MTQAGRDSPTPGDAPVVQPVIRHDLFLKHRDGFFWRLRDEGIKPEADRLSFPIEGRWGFRRYADIVSVNLSSAHIPRSGTIGQCVINFDYRETVTVLTANAAGMPDPSRHAAYSAFLTDFHTRILASGYASRIRFVTGLSPGRAVVLTIALAAGAVLFVVLPIILAMIARSWEPFELMLAGALFLWPAWETATKNQPGSYNPAYPPDLLA